LNLERSSILGPARKSDIELLNIEPLNDPSQPLEPLERLELLELRDEQSKLNI
jgi:hypothetical protein